MSSGQWLNNGFKPSPLDKSALYSVRVVPEAAGTPSYRWARVAWNGVIDDILSLQWGEYARAPGEAKIVALYTERNNGYLAVGEYIFNTDRKMLMEIVETEIDGSGLITARALDVLWELGNRTMMIEYTVDNWPAEVAMIALAIQHMYQTGEMPISYENVPGTRILAYRSYTETVTTDVNYKPIIDNMMEIAEMTGLCFKAEITVLNNDTDNLPKLFAYKGIDRRSGAPGYVGYFGDDIGNAALQKLKKGIANHKNYFWVMGGAEPATYPTWYASFRVLDGLPTREALFEFPDVKNTYSVDQITGYDADGLPIITTATGTYTQQQYLDKLEERGQQEVRKYKTTFEANVETTESAIKFGKDYGLGDIIPVKIAAHNIEFDAEVTGVRIVYENNTKSVCPILSTL